MSTTSPLLGRKFSAGRLKRHREAVERRKSDGFYKANAYKHMDPRTKIATVTCAYPPCGKLFEFTFSPRFAPDRRCYCSHGCQVRHNHMLRTRVPDDGTLRDLYVVKNLTALEIGNLFGMSQGGIRDALIKAGIPRRKAGARRKSKPC